MPTIDIKRTSDTPGIYMDLNEAVWSIEGRSIPENAPAFYEPVFNWLEHEAGQAQGKRTLKIKLDYFNTTSSKCFLRILVQMDKLHASNPEMGVEWHVEEEDYDMQENVEEYQDLVSIPISCVLYAEED